VAEVEFVFDPSSTRADRCDGHPVDFAKRSSFIGIDSVRVRRENLHSVKTKF
jgi:hypothetical protein